jgi:hypothetical protein
LSGAPSLTTTATTSSAPGAYPITITQGSLAAANYSFTFVNSTLTVGKADQTITFGALGGKTYGDGPFTVSATGSSGLPASFAVGASHNCTISGSTVTITGAGSCTVTASQAGDANYNAAAPVSQTFSIAKAALTVTADNQSRAYLAANPTFTATITGFVNGQTLATSGVTGSPSLTTTATVASPAGTYPITAAQGSLSAANYSFTFVDGTLTVTQASQTITFGALANKTYGDAPFVVSATASSGLAVSFSSQTASICTVSGNTVTILAAGDCTIRASQAGDSNYSAAPDVDQTFTIGKATPVITWNNPADITYGTALSATQLDATANVPGTFAYTPVAGTVLSAGGNQQLSVSFTPSNTVNYTSATATAVINVTKATLTVTAQDKTKTYGAANPPLTATITGFVNGETDIVVSGAPALSTTATETSGVGSYPITAAVGTLAVANYSFAFVPGTLTVTQASQTITFATLPDKTYGDAPFVVSATASSGLTVSFAASGNCTLDNTTNTVTITGAGSCTVTASQAGNANYSAAPNVEHTFVIAKGGQTITFDGLTNKTYGDGPFTVSATASSGLAVSFSSQTESVCTVSGNTVTIVTAGDCTIRASQAGDANYNAAPNVDRTFSVAKATPVITWNTPADITYGTALSATQLNATAPIAGAFAYTPAAGTVLNAGAGQVLSVTFTPTDTTNYNSANATVSINVLKAVLTVTVDPQTKVYGDANPALTYSFSGFVGTDNAGNAVTGTPDLVTTANATSPAGSYPITISVGTLSTANYSFSFVNGVLTVTKRAVTATADAKSKVYGATDPQLTYQVTAGALVGADAFSGALARDPGEAVGSYAIKQGTLALSDNYALTFVGASLTVTPAMLTVTARDQSRAYGAANPALTYTIAGFANGDNQAVVSGQAECSTAATATSAVGDYAITCSISSLAATNYTFSFVGGMLHVTKAGLTVTADNASRTYGATNPAFTGNVVGIQNGDPIVAGYSTAATPTSPVGTYAIVPAVSDGGTGALANYDVTLTNGTLTVNQATLTVTADNASRQYGAANPAFTASYSGFANGETLATSGVTGSPSLTTTADATSPVGSYAITAVLGSLASGNYSFTFVNGTLTVTAKALTITAKDQSKTYGQTVTFAGSEFTASGMVNGDKVDSVTLASAGAAATAAAGGYPITPSAAVGTGLDNYIISYTNGMLTVTKAALTITAADKTKIYGAANPELTGTIAGIQNGDGITATYSTAATAGSPVGTYAIVPAAVDSAPGTLGNYDVTLVNGTLTVTRATLTVTADNKSKVYGAANPALTASYAGFVNGDTPASLATPVSLTTTPTEASGVGSYTIVASGASSPNYEITFVNGTLSVTKAALTVTANAATKVYGEANPAFSVSYAGFVLGQDEHALGGTLAFATDAAAASAVGAYLVTPSGLTSDNYEISFVKGTLTVTARAITVTADAKSKVYGDNDPALTYQITAGSLVNGDTFSGALTREAGQGVGQYAIQQGTLALSANYDLTYVGAKLTIGKATLTVTANDKSRTYGDANPSFDATITGFKRGETVATSGVTGVADCTTAATVTTAVGDYAITCTTGTLASGNYDFAFVAGKLTITGATLTVSPANASRAYGETNPTFTGSITGQKNGESFTATYGTAATATSPVGGYDITVTNVQGATLANYSLDLKTATLTVTKATLTVTADNKSRVYGDANPDFTATITGFANSETLSTSGVIGNPSLITAATASSPVNTYSITAAQGTLASANYDFAFVAGTLTVGKATLTVTADNKSKVYGAANPALTASYSGFANGETLATSGMAGAPSLATAAAPASAVGSYTITAVLGSLAATNYQFSFVNGTLTVIKADQTISFNPAAPPGAVYGGTYTVGATGGGSGNPVIFSSTTLSVCTVSGSTVTFVGVGTCTVAADQAGNGNYNAAPQVTQSISVGPATFAVAITGPSAGAVYATGAQVPFTGTVTYPLSGTNSYTFTWTFTSSASTPVVITTQPGSGTTSGTSGLTNLNYAFTNPGVYKLKLTVTDSTGKGSGEATQIMSSGQLVDAYVVIYDPSAGFVTGGGWIDSPIGACKKDTLQSNVCATDPGGRANFGFVSKYQNGAKTPTGQTEFQFKDGNLNFHSEVYDWLVVSGAQAQYKGTGTINGVSGYSFMLTVTDGDLVGGGKPDLFRIKIWRTNDGESGGLVYDNKFQTSSDNSLGNGQAISGGSIQIKTK